MDFLGSKSAKMTKNGLKMPKNRQKTAKKALFTGIFYKNTLKTKGYVCSKIMHTYPNENKLFLEIFYRKMHFFTNSTKEMIFMAKEAKKKAETEIEEKPAKADKPTPKPIKSGTVRVD